MAATVRKPVSVVATAVAAALAIRITWAAGSGGLVVDTFYVYRATSSTGTYTAIGSTPAGTTIFDDTTGIAGRVYYYYVVAASGTKLSSPSAKVHATFPTSSAGDTTAPTTPGTPTASLVTNNSFTATSSGSTDAVGVVAYDWYLSGTAAGSTTTPVKGFSGLTPNTLYSVTVKARDAAGNVSSASAALSQATKLTTMAAPTCTVISSTQIDVSFPASTDPGVASYDISKDGGTPVNQATNATLSFTGLTPDTDYTFKVRPVSTNPSQTGTYSAITTAHTDTNGSPPSTWATQNPPQLPVIPGMAGPGMETAGGNGTWNGSSAVRSGVTTTRYYVTTLADAVPAPAGSLRAACTASGPRQVIFNVSGVITLVDDIQCYNPYLTISGETAPAPGILVRGATIAFKANDQVITHVHLRPGDRKEDGSLFVRAPGERDGFSFAPEVSGQSARNVMDHCSISWACDENIQVWYTSSSIFPNGITISRCIIAEGLYQTGLAGMLEQVEGYGPLIGQYADNVCLIGNLIALNAERNPLTRGKHISIVNNVFYGWKNFCNHLQGDTGGVVTNTDIVGNVYITGAPASTEKPIYLLGSESVSGLGMVAGSKVYMTDLRTGTNAGNVTARTSWDTGTLVHLGTGITELAFKSVTPVTDIASRGVVATGSDLIYDLVRSEAGAFPNARDPVDVRIIGYVDANTGSAVVNTVAAAGGWPVYANNTVNHTTNPILLNDPIPPTGSAVGQWDHVEASGYKLGEEWLHRLADRLIP